MGTDKADFQRVMPGYQMYYDTDFNYAKDRDYWLKLILGMGLTTYIVKKLAVESDRSRMTERLNGFPGVPAHHFHNRGGVVVKKEFTGFEKYYQNSDDVYEWYKMAYPAKFATNK